MSPDEARRAMIIEFSVNGAQLARLAQNELRESCRVAIFKRGLARDRFQDTMHTYDEAFVLAFNERLDRRSVPRDLPDPEGEADER